MSQEHGDRVHVVADAYRPESGDGIVVLERGVAATIKTADCLPVILAHPDYPVAAIVHAGWRGTVRESPARRCKSLWTSARTGKKLPSFWGPPSDHVCYEVQRDVEDVFKSARFSSDVIHRAKGSLLLDIKRANIETLRHEGIERIYDMALCTYCSNGLFNSYRRGEKERRQINFVSLR